MRARFNSNRVKETLCSVSVEAELHREWVKRIQKAGFMVTFEELKNMRFTIMDTIRDEGLISSILILKGYLKPEARERLKGFSRLFKETEKYLGYGIYVGNVN